MVSQNYITREALAERIGCHVRTINRKLKRKGMRLPPGLVSPADAEMVTNLLLHHANLEEIRPDDPPIQIENQHNQDPENFAKINKNDFAEKNS
jgi:hypothetical protein